MAEISTHCNDSHAGRGLQPQPKRLDVSIVFET